MQCMTSCVFMQCMTIKHAATTKTGNLCCRYIGCGRKLYGVADSGCLNGQEGAAVLHWEEDKQNRPLAVKLGTITPSSADIFSYPEDAMVIDSKLSEHLAHFGINIQKVRERENNVDSFC